MSLFSIDTARRLYKLKNFNFRNIYRASPERSGNFHSCSVASRLISTIIPALERKPAAMALKTLELVGLFQQANLACGLSSVRLPSIPIAHRTIGEPLQGLAIKSRGFRILSSALLANNSGSVATEVSPVPSTLERLRDVQLVNEPMDQHRSPHKSAAEVLPEKDGFHTLGLSEELLSAVHGLGLSEPTEIQALGIPGALSGQSLVVASHTGSGKTLAYLLPLVQMIKRDEKERGLETRPKRPRALILVPTRELAEQVLQVAKSLSHYARFRSAIVSGGARLRPQVDALASPLDVLVATPGRLLQHIKAGNVHYKDVKYVVLDEADTMFDEGFGVDLRKLLQPLRTRAKLPGDPGFQTILVTATITKAVQRLLDEEFPGIRHIRTTSLHKRVANARHDFLPVAGSENKLDTLLQVVETSLAKGQHVMVFCNTVQSCRAVDHFLQESSIHTVNYHGEVPADERVKNLDKFRGGGSEDDEESAPALVCTDLAARGLDLSVDHVIMFDFPQNPVDYLHRTGRTARMGAKGRITSLVTKRDYILASQVELAMAKGLPLDGLTSSKTRFDFLKRQEVVVRRQKKDSQLPKEPFWKTRSKQPAAGGASSSGGGSEAKRRGGVKEQGKGVAVGGRGTRGAARPGASSSTRFGQASQKPSSSRGPSRGPASRGKSAR
eukprot:jgi/Mesen1/5021/ME000025S04420